MKKLLSISLAVLMLLSGMNLTVATHFCGGSLAASKVSFSGKLATCGMENETNQCAATGLHSDTDCCTNHVSHLNVDHNYSPEFFAFKYFGHQLLQVFVVPQNQINYSYTAFNVVRTNASPPGIIQASDVSLPDICVFRI
jgi:hypothetical protein